MTGSTSAMALLMLAAAHFGASAPIGDDGTLIARSNTNAETSSPLNVRQDVLYCSADVAVSTGRPGTDTPWVQVTLLNENGSPVPGGSPAPGELPPSEKKCTGGLGPDFCWELQPADDAVPTDERIPGGTTAAGGYDLEFDYGLTIAGWTTWHAWKETFKTEADGATTTTKNIRFACEG